MDPQAENIVEKTVKIRDAQEKLWTHGKVRIQHFTQAERSKRAIKFAGYTLLAAFASVFIPIVHFIAVPSLLLATPFVFGYFVNRDEVLLGGAGKCPHCKSEFRIEGGTPKFPYNDLCDHCKNEVWLELEDT